MYYSGSDFNPCHGLCPLYGGCPPLEGPLWEVPLYSCHNLCTEVSSCFL